MDKNINVEATADAIEKAVVSPEFVKGLGFGGLAVAAAIGIGKLIYNSITTHLANREEHPGYVEVVEAEVIEEK